MEVDLSRESRDEDADDKTLVYIRGEASSNKVILVLGGLEVVLRRDQEDLIYEYFRNT